MVWAFQRHLICGMGGIVTEPPPPKWRLIPLWGPKESTHLIICTVGRTAVIAVWDYCLLEPKRKSTVAFYFNSIACSIQVILFRETMALRLSTTSVVAANVSQLLAKTVLVRNTVAKNLVSNRAMSSQSSGHFQASWLVGTCTQSGHHSYAILNESDWEIHGLELNEIKLLELPELAPGES